MATKIPIVTTKDFLEVAPDGTINMTTRSQLLVDIAKAEHPPVLYDPLIGFFLHDGYLDTGTLLKKDLLCRHS